MFIPTSAYEPGFPLDWEGLDYQSAIDATPRLYGVSSGNGNDGVSHMYPDYYVRTCEPYRLAQIAIVSEMNPSYYRWAIENNEVDGEAEYGISATLYDPPDDFDEGESWSEHNGAWLIVEVFPVDPDTITMRSAMQYESLRDAFSADMLELVKE